MSECLFTSRGETRARLMLGELTRKDIRASIRRLPLELAKEGCAFGVAVARGEREHALYVLKLAGFLPRRVYCMSGGVWREVRE